MTTRSADLSPGLTGRAKPSSATRTTCLFVTQWYPPEPAVVAERITQALRDSSFDVSVLTGMPHYPAGRVFSGYRAGRPVREHLDGISVSRTPEYPSHSSSVVARMATYLSWAVSSTLLGQRALRSADVALVYSSPATSGLPALVGKLLHRTPYVLVIQDLWPDSVFAAGFGTPLVARARGALDLMCRVLYRHAAHICVISPGMVDVLVSRGVPREKLTLVYNWRDDPQPAPPHTIRRTGPVRVLYAGNHGRAQGLEALVRAAAASPTIDLTLIGDGVDKPRLIQVAKETGASNVYFRERLDREEFEALQGEFDVQVASLGADPLFSYTMPSKVQGILAAGMPLLAIASGDVARAADASGAGWTADPDDVDSIRRALGRIGATTSSELESRGHKARRYYDQHMGREDNLSRLRAILETASSRPQGARR
ncbi:glycosyltransferase family 4 protein [Georgenia sp. Marseille-Q6866]